MSGGNWKELFNAACEGDLELVRYHVDNGVDINYAHPEFLATPLVACLLERQEAVAMFLLDSGANPHLLSEFDGLTPWQAARQVGLTAVEQRLASLGAGASLPPQFETPHHQEATMPRPVLDEAAIHAAIRQKVAGLNGDLLRQAQTAVASNAVMVFGMSGNPWVGKARKTLAAAGVAHGYLEIGSYFSQWRRRNALKMWTGWPTFPMVFVHGVLVGGAEDVRRLVESGELQRLLAA